MNRTRSRTGTGTGARASRALLATFATSALVAAFAALTACGPNVVLSADAAARRNDPDWTLTARPAAPHDAGAPAR